MLVVRFNQQRRRPPKAPVPQDALPKVEVEPRGQSIRAQLRRARASSSRFRRGTRAATAPIRQ
jgi:hypothetical protein